MIRIARSSALLLLLASAACTSVEVGADGPPCQTQTDCSARGPGLVCVNNVCVSSSQSSSGSSAGSGSTGSGGGGPTCTSSKQCSTDLAAPHLCKDGACVPILSEDCSDVTGQYDDPNAILLGMLSTFKPGPDQHNSKEEWFGVQLALNEFDQSSGGLPSANGKRPIAVVACDEDTDVHRAVKHLTDDLGIVGIIGPLRDSHALDVANMDTINHTPGVLLMLPYGVSPVFPALQDNGLVWSMALNGRDEVGALAGSMTDVEATIRAQRGLLPTQSIKVMVIARGDSFGKGVADLLAAKMTFNLDSMGKPKSVAQNTANGNYERIDYQIGSDYQTTVIAPVFAFKPDVIVGISGGNLELTKDMEAPIEQNWPDPTPRPYWIMQGYPVPHQFLLPPLKTASLRQRFRAESEYVEQYRYDLLAGYQTRHEAAFMIEPGPDSYTYYDSVYILAYAALAAGNIPSLTGNAIATGIGLLNPPGAQFDIGPTDMTSAMSTLYAGGDIALRGIDPMDWDSTGTPQVNVAVYCVKADFSDAELAGQVWDVKTGGWVPGNATYDCP